MIVNWQKFDWVEVQVFKPVTPTKKAILFCPGFPGAGGGMFEQRHAAALTHEGYDFYVIHHKGTRTMGAMAPVSINNGKRLQDAWGAGETHLGGGAVTMEELLDEPLVVLKAIAGQYESIDVIGNSFGALSSLKSLTMDVASTDVVKSLVLLAGAQGIDDGSEQCIMQRVWRAEFMEASAITDQIDVIDSVGALDVLRTFYRELPKRVVERLPSHINLTYVVVEKDTLVLPSDTDAFQKAVGGRGTIVMEYDEGFPAYGITPHYTTNYRTSNLLKIIRG